MNNTTRILLVLLVVAVLAVGGFLAFRPKDSTTTNSTQPSNSTTSTPATGSSTESTSSTEKTAAATITYDGKSFSPAEITVKAGDTIKITNSSSDELSFNSDPHPTHTDEPELNVGNVDHNQSQTFTVTKTGTWGYHNHFDQSQRGKIIVE